MRAAIRARAPLHQALRRLPPMRQTARHDDCRGHGRRHLGRAGPDRPRGTARHPIARAGQFGLGKVAPTAPAAGAVGRPGAAGGDRSRGRFRHARADLWPCRGRGDRLFGARDRANRRPAARTPRLGGAQPRGSGGGRPDALRRDLPVGDVRCAARTLVSSAGSGRRGAALCAHHGRRGGGGGTPCLAVGDDQPDVPRAQARPRRRDRDPAPCQARQERRGRGVQLPDGAHLSGHRHGACRRPARHGAPAGGGDPRFAARHLPRARARSLPPSANGEDRRGRNQRALGQPQADPASLRAPGGPQGPDLRRTRAGGRAAAADGVRGATAPRAGGGADFGDGAPRAAAARAGAFGRGGFHHRRGRAARDR